MRTRSLVAGTVAATLAVAGSAAAHDPRDGLMARSAAGVNLPVVTSPNVRLLSTFPETQAISGEHAHTGTFFYVSSLDTISVFDTSDPKNPRLRGQLGNLVFENEAMTYGERKGPTGNLQRFVLVGNDLYNVSADGGGVKRGRVGGGEVIVVDVSNPDNPRVRSRTPRSGAGAVTTSTHTVQCLTVSCSYAYSAGDSGTFSVIDLRDLDNPREVATPASSASAPNAIFSSGSGHYWDVDQSGVAWHTGSGGAQSFVTTDPLNPRAIASTNEQGVQSPYNDFILHNSMRPNSRQYRPSRRPSYSVNRGNVLLVTEEDYANDGDEIDCTKAGTFQTWGIADSQTPGSIKPLDITNPVAEFGGGLSTPIGGFCSAHWFDYHQSGIVAQGYYQQGLRFLDVRDPKNIKQFGFFTGGASEVWDAYWVPVRDSAGRATGRKTNVVYTADLVRGLDVFEVDLP